MTHEPDYGNRMIYSEMLNSTLGKAEFTLERKDHKPSFVCASTRRLVAPDSLIPTDGKLKALSDRHNRVPDRYDSKSQGCP